MRPMNDFLSRYALFLAETLTLAVVIVGLVALAMRMSRRGRGRYRLSIRNVNRRYDQMALALTAQLEPKQVVKQRVKADRRRRKAETKARRSAPGGPRKPRMFVLDFHGDVRATQATSLREEVTAENIAEWGCDPNTLNPRVTSLWGSSATEVFFAVLDERRPLNECGTTFVLYYDGTEFHQM